MKKETINILSIDGGGIRGLLPAEILIYVENKLKKLYNKDIKLADHFDYIAGTSTGGMLSCIYTYPNEKGKPKYSAQDASDLYFNHGSKIFKKGFRFYLTLDGLLSYRYSAKPIEKLFEKYFGNTKISESVKPLMLTSVDTNGRDIYLFKSYKAEKYPKHNRMFREASRATGAASTYYKPFRMEIDGKELALVDGGFGVNNPTMSAYIEALKIFPDAKKINILTLGTGPKEESYSYDKSSKWGVINGAAKLFDLILTSMSDSTQYQINKLYEDGKIKGELLRVQPNTYGAKDRMDNASKKNLILLRKAGQKSVEDYKERIDIFLEKTVNKH